MRNAHALAYDGLIAPMLLAPNLSFSSISIRFFVTYFCAFLDVAPTEDSLCLRVPRKQLQKYLEKPYQI